MLYKDCSNHMTCMLYRSVSEQTPDDKHGNQQKHGGSSLTGCWIVSLIKHKRTIKMNTGIPNEI